MGYALLGLLILIAVATYASTSRLRAFGASARGARLERMQRSAQFHDGKFENAVATSVMRNGPSASVMLEFFKPDAARTPPAPLPVVDPTPTWSSPPRSGLRVTWLGHSALLLELDGLRVLTDPIWAQRSSPSTLVGPKRFHPPPVAIEALPALDAVVLSHDHYDHLDLGAIQTLARRGVPFFAPLGVGAHLEAWGVPAGQIHELDWWDELALDGKQLRLVATPARHFSGRGLLDRNSTLWCSWVLATPSRSVYFSGDTGLFPELSEIAKRYGPFELVALEIGAYHPSWGDIHLGPEGAVEAWKRLGGGALIPIHWGTFNLGLHGWMEPGDTLLRVAGEQGVPLLVPRLGAPVEPAARPTPEPWWRALAGAE